MELFIIIALQLLIEVQSYKHPNIKVSPDVARESTSVYVTCETPADVTVTQCYFQANGQIEKDIKVSQSCQLTLSGAEILNWTGVKSPVTLDFGCYYRIAERGVNKPSDHSPPATLTILETLEKPIISVEDSTAQLYISCETPLRADVTCNLYTDNELLRHTNSQRRQSGNHYCPFYTSVNEIFTHKQTVNSRQLSCDYSPKTKPKNEMNFISPRSDVYTIRGFSQAKLTASSSVITDTETVLLVCMNSENQKMDVCFFKVDGIERNMKQTESCQLSLTGSKIIHWSGGQKSTVNITCFYTVNKSGVRVPSPQSDPVRVQISTLAIIAHTTTTVMKTVSTTISTTVLTTSASQNYQRPEDYGGTELNVPLLSTAIGVFMVVLVGVTCLCQFKCSEKCLHSCLMMENSSKHSGSDDVLTMVIYSTSGWQPQSKEQLV